MLVPGAGLGRLAFDIAKAGMQHMNHPLCKVFNGLSLCVGFSCQGNYMQVQLQ